MNKSETIKNLAKALTMVQSKFPRVKFDATNPFLKNRYATLGAVIEASLPLMAEAGLSIVQFPTSNEGRIGVRTILMHESGEFIEDSVSLVPESGKGVSLNQAAGVTITYLKRYSWASILGLVSEEDTDGDNNPDAEKAQTEVKKQMERTWSLEQMEAVIEESAGLLSDHMEVSAILDFSVLPENAPVGTVKSWFKHYMKSQGKDAFAKSADANEAYQKAKKSK